jgi:hypothetical protein
MHINNKNKAPLQSWCKNAVRAIQMRQKHLRRILRRILAIKTGNYGNNA